MGYEFSTFTVGAILKQSIIERDDKLRSKFNLHGVDGIKTAVTRELGKKFVSKTRKFRIPMASLDDNKNVKKDVELLSSQLERCSEILKKLTLNPVIEDNFIDGDLTISDYVDEIIKSFQQTSVKNFIVNYDQNSNPFNITKSIEIVYGLRNFIGNANKFSENKIFINIKSDSDFTEVMIEDDGEGYPKDVLSKIGEPYIKSFKSSIKSKSGLGLGIFIGKTLLEKNYANILCRNSQTRSGAEVSIKWKNEDLLKL